MKRILAYMLLAIVCSSNGGCVSKRVGRVEKVSLPTDTVIKSIFTALASQHSSLETLRQARARLMLWTGNDTSTPVEYNREKTDLASYITELDILKPIIKDVKTERSSSRILKFIVIHQ